MRAIGFAALSFGAVVALSATLGMSYRSTASPLDDPTASVSDTSSPVVSDSSSPTADTSTPATDDPTTAAATDDATTPAATDDATAPVTTDSSSPSAGDSSSPADEPSPSDDPAPAFHALDIRPFSVTNPAYTFSAPNSVDVSFDIADGADNGSITFVPANSSGADVGTGSTSCVVDSSDVLHRDCTLNFSASPGHGLWHLTAVQNFPEGTETDDTYVYIPIAPTVDSLDDSEGWSIFGTGTPGDSVEVFNKAGDLVCGPTTVDGGDSGNQWTCRPDGEFDGSDIFTARQIDAGNNDVDGVTDPYLVIHPGGISLPSAAFDNRNIPTVTYNYFPGGIVIHAVPTGAATIINGEIDGWAPGSDTSFPRLATCPPATGGESPPIGGPVDCTFTAPGPGLYNPYISQLIPGSEAPLDYVDDYFSVPVTPSISRAVAGNTGRVTLTGTGVATDGIRVIIDDATVTCSGTVVSGAGTWTCTTGRLSKGLHTFRAYDVDLGAGRSSAIEDPEGGDSGISYMTGGLSALSSPASARVTSTGVTDSPAPTASPTDFADWFFTITGVDLNNVHPGDTFTVSGTGLPPGSTVSGELHSKAVSIGSAVVQPDGTFSLPVTVPADFPAGAHTIVMTLTPPGSSAVPSQQPLKVVPTSDSSGSGDTPTPSDSPSPLGSSEGPGIDHHGPNSNILTHGLQSIADVVAHPAKIPAAIEIGLVLLIFAVLPGHLLNATLAEQYERFTKRRAQRTRGPGRWARFLAFLNRAPFVAGLALTTATALLFGFADPRFGFSLASLRLFLGLAIALALVSYITNAVVSRIMQGRWKVDVEVNLRPLGLILTVVGVVVSRLFDFSPGFLIGLVLGLVISEKQLAKHAWRAVLLRTSILLGLALLAWLAFSLFDAREEGGTFASELAIETLVAITTEAVVGLMVELLPLKLLEGEKLYEKSKVIWGSLYLLTVVIFVVAVVPWEGNWAELGSSLWTWIGIVVGFGIVATGVYLYFRIRGHEEHEEHVITDADDDKLVPIGSEDEA